MRSLLLLLALSTPCIAQQPVPEPAAAVGQAAKLAEAGKFAEAIVELTKALEINPRSEQLHYALAQRYAPAGDRDNALKWLGTAITRQPRVWKPRVAEDPVFEKLRSLPEFKRPIGNQVRRMETSVMQ